MGFKNRVPEFTDIIGANLRFRISTYKNKRYFNTNLYSKDDDGNEHYCDICAVR